MTEETARNVFAPHEALLRQSVQLGFDVFREHYVRISQTTTTSSRTASSLLNDCVAEAVEQRLSEPFVSRRGIRRFIELRDTALIQFKRLGHDGRPSNISTHFADEIEENGQVLLPGMEELPLLTIGYEVPPTHDTLSDLRIVYVSHHNLNWSFSILDDSQEPPQALPLGSLPPALPSSTIIRIRDSDETAAERRSRSA